MFLQKMKNHDGFTLVELIVVIAIMAILAGVAVPAYSGYIEKANVAGDQQLLAAVNTAFAAACLENESDISQVTGAAVQWGANKTVTGVTGVSGANVNGTKVSESFAMYYAGNEASTFKAELPVVFDSAKHLFVLLGVGESVTVNYRGTDVTISGDVVASIKDSTWGTKTSPEELLGLVSSVTGLAQSIDSPTYLNMLNGENFASVASDIFKKDYRVAIGEMVNSEFSAWFAENPDATPDEQNAKRAEIGNAITANTAVLVAAKNASAASTDIMSILASGDAKETIKKTMNDSNNAATGLSQAALAYGMYTSYMYHSGKASPDDGALDPTKVMNALSPETNSDFNNFKTYLESDQGKQDMAGYLAALNTVNSNSGIASDVVVNGFGDTELETLFGSIMG